jgi:23S rRNA pseudouridine955/2504/2580 synthase
LITDRCRIFEGRVRRGGITIIVNYINLGAAHQFVQRSCYHFSMNVLQSNTVQWLEIDLENAGQRVDNFLMSRLKGVPKSHLYRILRTGEVRRNGGRIQAKDRLAAGDVLRLPPVRSAERGPVRTPEQTLRARLEPRILYEDGDLLALDKPSGMAVHGGSGLSYGVIEGFRAIRPEARFLELVHRLDRETSGCLLIAKRRSALRNLHEQFRADGVEKTYLSLLAGAWSKRQSLVEAPLRKNHLQGGERVVKVAADGKPAATEFVLRRRYSVATLVAAKPITGRTHQIRVHALHMGHPVAGDDRYGDAATNQALKKLGLRRLFLHAEVTEVLHPRSGERLRIEAPMDSELLEFLSLLPE